MERTDLGGPLSFPLILRVWVRNSGPLRSSAAITVLRSVKTGASLNMGKIRKMMHQASGSIAANQPSE